MNSKKTIRDVTYVVQKPFAYYVPGEHLGGAGVGKLPKGQEFSLSRYDHKIKDGKYALITIILSSVTKLDYLSNGGRAVLVKRKFLLDEVHTKEFSYPLKVHCKYKAIKDFIVNKAQKNYSFGEDISPSDIKISKGDILEFWTTVMWFDKDARGSRPSYYQFSLVKEDKVYIVYISSRRRIANMLVEC